jgi:prevent-host-death family protein
MLHLTNMPKIHKVNMHDAKINLSKLVEQALAGDEVILARNGQAVVRFVPVEEDLRPLGLHAQGLSDDEAAEAMRPLAASEQAL